ncbi:A-kinase anchor protein 12b isoform X2 [Gouania willdenowi]|uniref:A-kinase anchor protein 12-like n=1 Tax=Gouania willdenowi TaxID=441366 RepID=A0A8C5I5G8_GOUWI|nr:A-kinase anchor protein 12-like isoform X2 [Gouania willdenowi]
MLGTITLTVGQPDGVSVAPKEDVPETMETVQDVVTPEANGEKVEKESPDANEISTMEEKAAEEKPDEASEVGFKKIFRFVGFKFTLKKDKSEEKDPVKLLTVKDKEEENLNGNDDSAKEDKATTPEEKTSAEEKDTDTQASTDEAEATSDSNKDKTTDADGEAPNADVKDELAKEEEAKNEEETSPPSQETTVSPFRKFFSGGLFSNLRKKASIKKTKEEQDKEASVEKDAGKTDETVNEQEDKDTSEQETNQEVPAEEKPEAKEEVQASPDEATDEAAPEQEVSAETPPPTEGTADETKQEDQEAEENVVEEKAVTEVSSEAELLSSQEKTKPHGSPLKKLFTGAGLKKLSTKKHKSKKDTESKATETSEQAEQQSSTESAEPPKAESGPSSPEETGEHVLSVETQIESSQETEGEVVSDGEKKKEGIIAWSSFKKLVTPKKRVKRPSESEDEAAGDKPAKSATLSSSESAPLGDKSVEEETKEEKTSEEEPKTENTEKLVSSTEEPKKKMDTSVSWEALMCMGGPKKRTRKTSDSDDDDDETKIEEDVPAAEGDQERKTEEAILTSQKPESEGEGVSSPELLCSSEKETTWDTLKRMVMSKSRAKMEEKPEENVETALSDSETPKDESSFSLRKFFPGRRKKKADKQASVEGSGEEDSDTPAVVPLSEYDKPEEPEPEAPAEPPAAAQTTVSSEERSPSWIQAVVEDDVRDQLSDIPEEAATPKSVDTDIADDENEDRAAFLRASGRSGRRLSTAEMKPVDQAPDAATTPVPQSPKSECAVDVIQGIEPQIHDIPAQTSATVEDVPLEVASEQTEYEPTMETAKSITNTLLKPHAREEAMAICTGLGTKEIAKVSVEKPVMSIVEPITVIRDALTTEVSVDEKQESTEVADLIEDHMYTAQVFQVQSTGLEDVVEESKNNILDLQAATGALEPQIENIAVVSTTLEESGVLRLPAVNANSPKTEIVSPIVPISETVVCTQSVVVSELTIETKETKMEMEQLEAIGENTPVREIVQTVTEEISSTICETATSTTTEEIEPVIAESIQNTKTPVITEAKILVAPLSTESDTKAASDSKLEQVHAEPTQEQETSYVLETSQETTKDEPLISDVTENVEELKNEANQTVEIEAQSMAITQSIIQDAVDTVLEDAPEPQTPVAPASPEAPVPETAQATSTIEAEIDTSTELPVVTDTPVLVLCENATSPQILCAAVEVVDTTAIEVTKNLEEEKEEPTEEVKKAVEVKVSEEIIILEEVKEIKAESQSDEKLGQTNKDASKEIKEVAAEDVKSDEEMPEAPSEESKVKDCEMMIHMPVQVVLQTAQVLEEPSVQEEAAQEFGTNGHDSEDAVPEPGSKLPVVTEEALDASVEEASGAAETEKIQTTKCAEVMAQVIEVIEEAVKEIEPVSSEITAAS